MAYLVGTGARNLSNPLNWSSTSGGTPADVLGSELIGVLDLNNWVSVSIASKTTDSFVTNGIGGVRKSLVVVGGRYKCTIEGTTTVSNFRVMNQGSAANYYIKTGSGTISATFYFIASANDSIYLRHNEAGTTTITLFTLEEVLSVPSATENAIIDNNSGTGTLTVDADFNCNDLIATNTQALTISGSVYSIYCYGNKSLSSALTITLTGTSYFNMKAQAAKNITMNGCTPNLNRLYFDGVGGSWTNQDNCNVGSTSIYHANGEWVTNDKQINSNLYWVTLGTKTLTLGSSHFKTGRWAEESRFTTFNYGTSTVEITQNTLFSIYADRMFYNLIFTGVNTISASNQISNNLTVQNTLTLSGNNAQNYRLLVASTTIGTPRTITVNGSIVASNVDFRDITLAGTANRDLSAISGGSGDCGGNSGITFTPAIDCYIKHTSGTMNFSDATKWVTTDGGTTQARVPLMQDRAWGTANSFTGAATINMNCPRIGSIDLSGVNQAVTFSLANSIECYGNYVLGNNITQSGVFYAYLCGRGNYFVNTYNKTLYALSLESPNCLYTNLSNIRTTSYFRVNSGCGTTGVFDFNGFNLNSDFAYIPAGITYFRNGIFTFTRIGSYLFWADGQIISENSTIILNPAPTTGDLTFIGGSKSFNKVIFSGSHIGNFVISSNNTFNELIIEKGRKVQITGGTTQTIKKLTNLGTTADKTTVTSTNTSQFILAVPNSGYLQFDNCNLSYCNAPANRVYAGKGSVNGGNNTNVLWRDYAAKGEALIKRIIRL